MLFAMSRHTLDATDCPVLPFTKSCRTVAKVDELMAFCDRLVAQLATTQTENYRFIETVHAEALMLVE